MISLSRIMTQEGLPLGAALFPDLTVAKLSDNGKMPVKTVPSAGSSKKFIPFS